MTDELNPEGYLFSDPATEKIDWLALTPPVIRAELEQLRHDHSDSEKALIDSLNNALDQLETMRRLHEIATERCAMLAAVINRAYTAAMMVSGKEAARILDEAKWRDILRERDAEKWDEGFDAGEADVWEHIDTNDWDRDCTPNPYREKKVD